MVVETDQAAEPRNGNILIIVRRSIGWAVKFRFLAGSQVMCSRCPEPGVAHVAAQGLAKVTVGRHRDNLWTLGGELIRCRYGDEDLADKHVRDALRQLIEGDGEPLTWPRITGPEQDSLDATCRKLNRFWRESATGKRSA